MFYLGRVYVVLILRRRRRTGTTGDTLAFFSCESENVSVIQIFLITTERVIILLRSEAITKVSNLLLQFNWVVN